MSYKKKLLAGKISQSVTPSIDTVTIILLEFTNFIIPEEYKRGDPIGIYDPVNNEESTLPNSPYVILDVVAIVSSLS